MIKTLVCKEHYVYEFCHHNLLFRAYDEIGRGLERLHREIAFKYSAARTDRRRHVYYSNLIPNLERQFAVMVSEGVLAGFIVIIEADEESLAA